MGNILVKLYGIWTSGSKRDVVQEQMLFKRILIWSFGSPPVRWSGTIYVILKVGILGSIQVMLYEIWTGGPGGDVI